MKPILPALALLIVASLPLEAAEIPRALPAGTAPDDRRLGPPKDLNGYFPFTPPVTKADWEQRDEFVRRRPQADGWRG